MRSPKIIFALAATLVTASAAMATVTINLGADVLFQSDGTTPIPTGALVQLVASTLDNTFTAPTATSFTGGSTDDVVLANLVAGAPGEFAAPVVLNLSGNLTTGDELMLRWWPTLTISSSTPGTGATFGQFRTDSIENFSDIAWVVPGDPSNVGLNFLDTAGGGTEPNSAGRAAFSVTAVPEPSTWTVAAIVATSLGAHFLRRRRPAR